MNPSPPSISLTPSGSMAAGPERRQRSRAGTLPSSFLNSLLSSQPPALSSSTSPLVAGQKGLDLSLLLMELPPQAIDIPTYTNNTIGQRRMRLGLLFSTNSIWNDDSSSPSQTGILDFDNPSNLLLTNTNSNGQGPFLSPLLLGQLGQANYHPAPRNRSYTTTAANAAPTSILDTFRLSGPPGLAPPQENFDNFTLDPQFAMANQQARNRSQTYSGTTPVLAEAVPQNYVSPNIPQQHFAPQYVPFLQDDFDYLQFVITTNFENPSLGPQKLVLFDNVPQVVDAAKLWQIVTTSLHNRVSHGVISVRVTPTTTSKLALLECVSIDVAMALKATFNHLELTPGALLYVAFAKLEPKPSTPPAPKSVSPPLAPVQSVPYRSTPVTAVPYQSTPTGPVDIASIRSSLLQTIKRLAGRKPVDLRPATRLIAIAEAYPNDKYHDNFGPLPEQLPSRYFDAPKLRELRKVLENNEAVVSGKALDGDAKSLSQTELEELCLSMLDELPELCYDYLGNTVVQKIFTLVESKVIKTLMVKQIAPYLTQLSIHKNGTWAIQKIINLCSDDYHEMDIIATSLKPYTVKLFNDQFGNYVVQCCVKFGAPYNSFIFEVMLDNFIEISSGRFGARCIRTILEGANDNIISRELLLLGAGLIVQFANDLVVNTNGSLLITWFLDTFNGASADDRVELMAAKFLPHLGYLCKHKLASLTILKILNSRLSLKSRQQIMTTIFGQENSQYRLLELILAEDNDNSSGPLFVYKVLSNASIVEDNPTYFQYIVAQVRKILMDSHINNVLPYKKLMEEVGLSSTRLNRSLSGNRRKRSSKKHDKPQDYDPVMHQLEQLSLSSAALGYASNPGTPILSTHKGSFF